MAAPAKKDSIIFPKVDTLKNFQTAQVIACKNLMHKVKCTMLGGESELKILRSVDAAVEEVRILAASIIATGRVTPLRGFYAAIYPDVKPWETELMATSTDKKRRVEPGHYITLVVRLLKPLTKRPDEYNDIKPSAVASGTPKSAAKSKTPQSKKKSGKGGTKAAATPAAASAGKKKKGGQAAAAEPEADTGAPKGKKKKGAKAAAASEAATAAEAPAKTPASKKKKGGSQAAAAAQTPAAVSSSSKTKKKASQASPAADETAASAKAKASAQKTPLAKETPLRPTTAPMSLADALKVFVAGKPAISKPQPVPSLVAASPSPSPAATGAVVAKPAKGKRKAPAKEQEEDEEEDEEEEDEEEEDEEEEDEEEDEEAPSPPPSGLRSIKTSKRAVDDEEEEMPPAKRVSTRTNQRRGSQSQKSRSGASQAERGTKDVKPKPEDIVRLQQSHDMQMNVVVLKELRRLDVSGYGGDRAAVRTLKEVQKLEARTRRGTSFK